MRKDICMIFILTLLTRSVKSDILERVSYENYRVYGVTASSNTQLKILKDIQNSSDSVIFLDDFFAINVVLQIVVAPHKVPDFLEILTQHEMKYKQKERNLQRQIDSVNKNIRKSRDLNYHWKYFQDLTVTYNWMRALSANQSEHVRVIEVGRTYQNRSILCVKISKRKDNKGAIFIMAGAHAREWITVTTATYIINTLVTSSDQNFQRVIEKYEWHIVPHANPDGYVFSYQKNRLWRKTRAPYGSCFGVDINRNWDYKWNIFNESKNPCLPTYAGPAPFSEIETRTISQYIKSLKGKLRLFISFHSYSQLIMYPYGYANKDPKNHRDYERVLNVSLAAIKQRYGTYYTGKNLHNALYPIAGSSLDWAQAVAKIPMCFAYELRPFRKPFHLGFLLPASEIIPTAEETLDSVQAMVQEVDQLGYFD